MDLQIFSSKHLLAAKAICDAQFGQDYLGMGDLEKYLAPPHIGLVATKNQELLGLTLIKIGDVETISKELLAGQDWFLSKFKDYSKIALRKHLAVLPGQEGLGIGRLLMARGMQLLEEQGIEVIISVVWKEGASKALHKLLTSFQSIPIHTIDNYWKVDSLKKGYICPGCKQLPCECSVTVYSKIIHQK